MNSWIEHDADRECLEEQMYGGEGEGCGSDGGTELNIKQKYKENTQQRFFLKQQKVRCSS